MTTIHTGNTTTTGFSVTSDTTGNLVIKTGGSGGTTALTVDDNQIATFANQPVIPVPMFSARLLTEQNITSSTVGTVILDEIFDSDNWYDPSTGVFSPTMPGYYQLNATIEYRASSGMTRIIARFEDENGDYLYVSDVLAGGSTVGRVPVSALHYFNGTSNTIRLSYFGVGTSIKVAEGPTVFSGFLVRAA